MAIKEEKIIKKESGIKKACEKFPEISAKEFMLFITLTYIKSIINNFVNLGGNSSNVKIF